MNKWFPTGFQRITERGAQVAPAAGNSRHRRNGRHLRRGSFVCPDVDQLSEHLLAEDRIIAVGLLTQRDVELLGGGFSRLWPLDETACFTELLRAIDEADRDIQESRTEPADAQPQEAHPQLMPGSGQHRS